ncbi:amidohydrolase family protein, partial [Aquifex sp.]
DAHTHLELFALWEVPFKEFSSKEELIKYLRSLRKERLAAYGLEYSLGITPEDLNQVPYPLLLIYKDGHKGIGNEALLRELGLESYTLKEHKLWEVANRLKPKGEGMRRALERGLQKAKEIGLSEIHDFVDGELACLYSEMELPVNVVLMPYFEHREAVLKYINKNLKVGWIKIYVDGSISARTAYLKEPYEDTPTRGVLLVEEKKLSEMIKEVEALGLRVALHAIGDGAIEVALNAFERANITRKYHRIEHAELITEKQITRAKELSLLLCMQPNFSCYYAEIYKKALGKRAKRINPFDKVYESGADLIFGTDMMPFDINYAVECAKKKLPEDAVLYLFGGWKEVRDYVNL